MSANRTAPLLVRMMAASDESDAELLRRYAAARDGAAFEVLVRRHGGLVLTVCRRMLGHAHDAEDAFQAAFLVLARKAGRIREPQLLSAWLYGVAVRVANKARARAARRREESLAELPERPTADTEWEYDLAPLLHAELAALPEWYRQALVLCDLQDVPRAEAAVRLGIPEGTLSSRLAAGRKRLAARLIRRGLAPAVASSATAAIAKPMAVTEDLIQRTVGIVESSGQGAQVFRSIAELTIEGTSMLQKTLLIVCSIAILSILGIGLAEDPAKPRPMAEPKPLLAANDPAATTASIAPPRSRGILEIPSSYDTVVWSADGRRIALSGIDPHVPATDFGTPQTDTQLVEATDSGLKLLSSKVSIQGTVIGPHPTEQTSVLVHLEESGGINVQKKILAMSLANRMSHYQIELPDPVKAMPTVTPRGKVLFPILSDADAAVELRELDLATGKIERLPFQTKEALFAISAAGQLAATGRHITRKKTAEAGGVPPGEEEVQLLYDLNVWDCRANRKLWTWTPTVNTPFHDVRAAFSFDGKSLAVLKPDGVSIHDANSGQELRQYLPNAMRRLVDVYLSHDGRLAVIREQNRPNTVGFVGASDGGGPLIGTGGGLGGMGMSAPPPPRPWSFVTVFDNATGKAIRKWETGLGLTLAFAPDRPALAVLERSLSSGGARYPGAGAAGGMTGSAASKSARLGLWEFPAK